MQRRMSFSRAEIVLINSWIQVQQIVYHMLRVFFKIKSLAENDNNSDAATLSNYHIKTLMLWACELKPRSWWIDDLNLVRLCVELLHTLGVWLTDVRCRHYFIHNCNLFGHPDDWSSSKPLIANRLMSETEASLADWFINNHIRRCAQFCPDDVSRLFDDVTDRTALQKAVSAVVDWSLNAMPSAVAIAFTIAQPCVISHAVFYFFLTVRSYLLWTKGLAIIDQRLSAYLTAVTFLHVAYKTARNTLNDELLDILSTTCLQSNDVRRYLNARHSSVLSLCQAAELMIDVANNSCSTVQLIEIELSKAYLYRMLRCNDSDSIYCLANVYLAVLCYITGQHQTAIDHCTLVEWVQDHSRCSSHVVQGEFLPKIDDEIDNALGLAVFYHYLRTDALNQQQQTQHVNVFTTELFAHYLHIRCLSTTKCRQLAETSSADKVQRYRKCFYESQETFITDVLVFSFANRTKCAPNDHKQVGFGSQTMPRISHSMYTSERLVELLQQSAVEHLTAFRRLLGTGV